MDAPKPAQDIVWQCQRQELRRTAELEWPAALFHGHDLDFSIEKAVRQGTFL